MTALRYTDYSCDCSAISSTAEALVQNTVASYGTYCSAGVAKCKITSKAHLQLMKHAYGKHYNNDRLTAFDPGQPG